MGVNPARFASAGRVSEHYIPGAYSRDNFISNEGGGVSSGNSAVLGYAELGEPNKLLVFSSTTDARNALLSGEGLDGVLAAFNPGGGYTPQEVGFIRVNPGTQSSRALQASAVDIFSIKSFSWGVPMNQVRLFFSAGTTASTFRVRTEFKGNFNDQDDIVKQSFTIQYTGGTGSAGVMTIDATTLTTTITGDSPADLAITLAEYPTISELVEFINNNADYTATILADNILDKSIEIDAAVGVDVFTAPYTETSNYQAVYDALAADPFLGAVTKSGVNRVVPDVDTDYVYLTGATSGAYTTSEFSDSLDVAKEEDIQLIGTPSEEEAVHILFRNHCDETNSVEGRKERQYYVGGALGETVEEVILRSKNLKSSFGSLCSPGFYNNNEDGVRTLFSPAMYACQQIGMVSALALNTPTTNKLMNNLGWEKVYTTSDLNKLIPGGVLAGGKDEDGNYITIRSVTTNQGSKLQECEASSMRETFFQDRDLRKKLAKARVGKPNIGLGTVDSVFERRIKDWKGEDIIAPYPDGSLYKGYTRKITGDQLIIEYETLNVMPNNFVFTTHNVSFTI